MTMIHIRAGVLAAAILGSAGAVQASGVTPDIIWGTGNQNVGFTVATVGSIELGLRAKRRYPANDTIGDGIVQDVDGNYLFDSADSAAAPGQSMWSYDWSINTSVDGNGLSLSAYTYQILLDTDSSVNVDYSIAYDPVSGASTGYYLGTNTSTLGSESGNFYSLTRINTDGDPGDLANRNVAQNSVQPQWVGGSIDPGQYDIQLNVLDGTSAVVASTEISVILDAPTPVPLPAALPMVLAGLGGLGLLSRRRRRAAANA